MENGFNTDNDAVIKMGATGNTSGARLATLQERKKTIEESLAKCTQELKQLCIQEADLTGTVPLEMPLEPGESPPMIRRRVGTSYQLPENLLKNCNNKDELIADMELRIQLHANMAEAALELANKQNISKTLRRKHMTEYQQHKKEYANLQDKLTCMKDKTYQQDQYKQKKKPRPAVEQDDNISLSTSVNDSFTKSELRLSTRSAKCSISSENNEVEPQLPLGYRVPYKTTTPTYQDNSFPRQEESLATSFYRLSINGYKNYMERRENMANIHMSYNNPPSNSLHYSHLQLNPHYQHASYQNLLQQQQQQQQQYQRSPQSSQPSQSSQTSLSHLYNYSIGSCYYNPVHSDNNKFCTIKSHQYSPTNQVNQLHRQSSPNIGGTCNNTQNINYFKQMGYRFSNDQTIRTHNPHQIQPHQQYESNVTTLGLGGYWKGSETGELVWCHTLDPNWQRDKRFGSLDRRKNKRLHKRVSPNVDNKSATLASVPTYSDHVRTASIKSPQVINRRSQDNQQRQLVRTQSLGSVGAQTIDSVWPSDDNSSCESDNRSINDINQSGRKQKQKGWLETSLDGPVSPSHSIISRSQSAIPSVLSPEEKYMALPPHHLHVPTPVTAPFTTAQSHSICPVTSKPLEIPAESNPAPKILDTNLELFNNNIPKNCTVVQAGHCKPYHEETKPFEMSDFYKYSTKFKKSPIRQEEPLSSRKSTNSFQKSLNESFEDSAQKTMSQTAKNHTFIQNNNLSPVRFDNSSSLNSSLDISQLSNANVAEHFSDEMNAWYKNHKFHDGSSASGAKSKSTATLV